MRRASRSSGSVVTTQIWVRDAPSGATSQASQWPSAEWMTFVTGPATGSSTSREELARHPREEALHRPWIAAIVDQVGECRRIR